MGRKTHYADSSFYSRNRLGEGLSIIQRDQRYKDDMELANAVFLRRLYDEHRRAGRCW